MPAVSLSIFGGAAYAEEFSVVNASLDYAPEKLESAQGAEQVLASLSEQARTYCRSVSMVMVGVQVDQTCVKDIVFQAVNLIDAPKLADAYGDSRLYVGAPSSRITLASK